MSAPLPALGSIHARSGPQDREHTQIKGFNNDQPFEPQVTEQDIEDFEKADKEAAPGAARLKVRTAFARRVLERTAPVTALSTKRLHKASHAIYNWVFDFSDDEEADAAPLG